MNISVIQHGSAYFKLRGVKCPECALFQYIDNIQKKTENIAPFGSEIYEIHCQACGCIYQVVVQKIKEEI